MQTAHSFNIHCRVLVQSWILTSKLHSKLSFFLTPTSFYLLIVGVQDYCCTSSHSSTLTRTHARTHTHKHTPGTTPPKEESAQRRDLFLTIKDAHKRQTSTSPSGIESAIPTSERTQTDALDRAATANDTLLTSLASLSRCKYTVPMFRILPRKTNMAMNQLLRGFL